ncbi:MAG: right-handed parallel beta-helix repeat-containing protein [Dehalococcoidia bacterium]|nr:right-handed parallel beta-helix repeat-containing protein [Dehalococcoidia bacterium]
MSVLRRSWGLSLAWLAVALAALLVSACDGDDATPETPVPTESTMGSSTPGPAATFTPTPEPVTVMIEAGETIQEVVDQHPPGTRFVLTAGVYREQAIEPRDGDIYEGEPGAILSGARVLEGFQEQSGVWVVGDQTQQGFGTGRCAEAGSDICQHPEQLFIDGEALTQVGSTDDLGPDMWFFDYDNDTIVLSEDPGDRLVETSVTGFAFTGEARGVVITGLTIHQYANRAQAAAIDASDGYAWTIQDNDVSWNHGYGIRTGDSAVIRGNHVHDNGQIGIGGQGDDVLVEGNEISYNNRAGFASGWEAGATKFSRTHNLVVRGNHVHHNYGAGLWTDIDNIDSLIEENVVEHNLNRGITHEISYTATIRNNTVGFNGQGYDVWFWGAQILVQNSQDVEVVGNQVIVGEAGGDGIAVVNQRRGDGVRGPWVSRDVRVLNNTIRYIGAVGQSGMGDDTDQSPACAGESGNVFDGNTYHVPDDATEYWAWCGPVAWVGFQERGQELTGTLEIVASDAATEPEAPAGDLPPNG